MDLSKLTRQCRTVLGREIEGLLDSSYRGKLSKDESAALISYMKYIPELRKQELEELETLTDEQLAKLANEESK